MRRAVVDVGSNSVLTCIGELNDGQLHLLKETSEVTGLGEGTLTSGVLSPEAMARTLMALKRSFELSREWKCETVAAAATMAARIAQNAREFVDAAEAQATPLTVLSGQDEASLGVKAVITDPEFNAYDVLTVFDIGGHSTEISRLSGPEVCSRSLPLGTLGLRGGLLAAERPTPADLLAASRFIDDTIGLRFLPGKCGTVVVQGATGPNLVCIELGLDEFDPKVVHGRELSYGAVSQAVSYLGSLGDKERAKVSGLEPGRERTIHVGALILERAMYAVGAETCRVSVRGWRHAFLRHAFL